MHTKGEWEYRGNQIFVEGTTKSIATVHVMKYGELYTGTYKLDSEADANAHLICRAPKMQNAILMALAMLSEGDPNIAEIKNILANANI